MVGAAQPLHLVRLARLAKRLPLKAGTLARLAPGRTLEQAVGELRRNADNPVLTPGPEGAWDDLQVFLAVCREGARCSA